MLKPVMSRPRKLLIDTDTASDDAVALIMALRSQAVTVEAITVVAGNVPVVQGTLNALYTAELCGSNVPVYMGAAAPLVRPLEDASWFHGRDGLADHGYLPATCKPAQGFAVDAIVQVVAANPGIEIITLGPLTNLALALRQAPGLAANVSRCVVMGGAPCCEGNVTPAAEYNLWVDPEAAQVVMRSQLPVELVGWQLCREQAVVNAQEIDDILALDTRFGEFSVRSNDTAAAAYKRQTGETGISLPDPVAMAILLDPALALAASNHYIDIAIDSGVTRGMSVVDRLNVAEDSRNQTTWQPLIEHGRRQTVVWQLDIPGWKQLLLQSLR